MRDLGYSLETAVADLLDNSISAGANTIRIFCDSTSDCPTLAVIDDGNGMDKDEIVEAMRYGSTAPTEQRLPGDLGQVRAWSQDSVIVTVQASHRGKRTKRRCEFH